MGARTKRESAAAHWRNFPACASPAEEEVGGPLVDLTEGPVGCPVGRSGVNPGASDPQSPPSSGCKAQPGSRQPEGLRDPLAQGFTPGHPSGQTSGVGCPTDGPVEGPV